MDDRAAGHSKSTGGIFEKAAHHALSQQSSISSAIKQSSSRHKGASPLSRGWLATARERERERTNPPPPTVDQRREVFLINLPPPRCPLFLSFRLAPPRYVFKKCKTFRARQGREILPLPLNTAFFLAKHAANIRRERDGVSRL